MEALRDAEHISMKPHLGSPCDILLDDLLFNLSVVGDERKGKFVERLKSIDGKKARVIAAYFVLGFHYIDRTDIVSLEPFCHFTDCMLEYNLSEVYEKIKDRKDVKQAVEMTNKEISIARQPLSREEIKEATFDEIGVF